MEKELEIKNKLYKLQVCTNEKMLENGYDDEPNLTILGYSHNINELKELAYQYEMECLEMEYCKLSFRSIKNNDDWLQAFDKHGTYWVYEILLAS